MYGTEPSQSEIEMMYQDAGIAIGDINLPEEGGGIVIPPPTLNCVGPFCYWMTETFNDYQ